MIFGPVFTSVSWMIWRVACSCAAHPTSSSFTRCSRVIPAVSRGSGRVREVPGDAITVDVCACAAAGAGAARSRSLANLVRAGPSRALSRAPRRRESWRFCACSSRTMRRSSATSSLSAAATDGANRARPTNASAGRTDCGRMASARGTCELLPPFSPLSRGRTARASNRPLEIIRGICIS